MSDSDSSEGPRLSQSKKKSRSVSRKASKKQLRNLSESSEDEAFDNQKTHRTAKRTKRTGNRAGRSQVASKDSEQDHIQSQMMDDDSGKENNVSSGDEEYREEEDASQEDSEVQPPEIEDIDHVKFFKEYNMLIKAARSLGDDLNVTEDFEAGSSMVVGNIETASELVKQIGSDPSKAVTAFTHALAITETASLNVKKCGNVSSFFTIDKYLDSLKNPAVGEDGEYSVERMYQILAQDVHRCTFLGYSLVSLLGVISIADPETADPGAAEKKKRSITKRATFDDTVPATQHQVVNSQVRRNEQDAEKDSVSESLRKAEQLKKMCTQKKKEAVGLFEYGLEKPESVQSFVSEVFNAAVLTRDGCARLFAPDQGEEAAGSSIDLANKLDAQLQVQAADPPDVSEEGFELNRTQHIVSLNAKAIRELLNKRNPPK